MMDQLITFETARLAKAKGFPIQEIVDCQWYYCTSSYQREDHPWEDTDEYTLYQKDITWTEYELRDKHLYFEAPTQSLLQRWIRETRGVHIEVCRNAVGYYWAMCKSDGGTDLGWSLDTGPNEGGFWDTFEQALEAALQVQLSLDLPEDTKHIFHWSNYVGHALKAYESR